jgi:hypothetical protein
MTTVYCGLIDRHYSVRWMVVASADGPSPSQWRPLSAQARRLALVGDLGCRARMDLLLGMILARGGAFLGAAAAHVYLECHTQGHLVEQQTAVPRRGLNLS